MQQRPTWEQYFKEIVQITATRSPCERLQVGCLLIKDNRIVAQGYNGFLAGCKHESHIRDGHEVATIHAEQNTIVDCAKRGVSCNECDAYITHYPCFNCCKLLLSSGIKNIFYINDYNNDDLVENYCREINVTINKI